MTVVYELKQIKEALKEIDVLTIIEEGFVAYSKGDVVVPPVGEMIFEKPPGDVHIKYGYIKDDDFYVIKIASGFYDNPKLNLPSSNGLMLVFSRKTGELAGILLDEGYLTDVRTAAAGAVAAKYLAPKNIERIGVYGAGTQGRLQLEYLRQVVNCRDVLVWGINQEELHKYKADMESRGFSIEATLDADKIPTECNLIITSTPSRNPLVKADLISSGTHITAVGADTPVKNELEPGILQMADIVVADSLSQCLSRGEIYQAIKARKIGEERPVELGNVILDIGLRRSSEDQIIVADLTGVAVQDIQISKAVYLALRSKLMQNTDQEID